MKNENPFRQKLYDHTLPVRDGLWDAIEKQLPVKEDKKLPLFWFVLFASTLVAGTLMFGYVKMNTANTAKDQNTQLKQEPSISSVMQEASDNTDTAHSSASEISPSSATSSETGASADAEMITSSILPKPNATKAGKAMPVIQNRGSTPSSGTSETKSTITFSATTHASPETSNVFEATSTPQFAVRNSSITNLLPLFDANELNSASSVIAALRKIKPDPSCYKFTPSGRPYIFSTDLFAGPGFSPRSFSDAGGESSVYSQARKSTEKNTYAWSAGARFNMHLHNGFAIRLGVMYDQAGDLFDYTDTLATQSTTRVDSFFSADGSFLYADTNRVLIFGTLIKKIHNTYRHLDVPILLSYETKLGRSTFMLNFGPVFNLSSSNEGQILDPMLIPRSITPGRPNLLSAYKTSLGLSLYFGAGFVFPISDHFAGIIEPRYLYRIKPVTITSYPLEEYRHYAGLNLGVRYFLN